VKGVVVGEGCDSNKYKIVFVDDVDSSVGDPNNYVGREYGNVCVIFVFRDIESVEGFLQIGGIIYLGEFARESRFSSVRGTRSCSNTGGTKVESEGGSGAVCGDGVVDGVSGRSSV
jgi:hypothetical protein